MITGVIGKDFSRYYEQFVLHATGEKENRLRGKAFECMSLLDVAVGKEKFAADAQEAFGAMLNTSLDADDLQREYIKEASERICTCLKLDFAPFLPALLPCTFHSLQVESKRPGASCGNDEYINVTMGGGKVVRVHSAKVEEMLQSVEMLKTFCTEMEGDYFVFVPPTAEALLPILPRLTR